MNIKQDVGWVGCCSAAIHACIAHREETQQLSFAFAKNSSLHAAFLFAVSINRFFPGFFDEQKRRF
ncbi:MAG: hypothetical protein KAG20_09310 [Cocleimonas sp.]|nr:hypothetical protein [Cocleimonas sp.]